MNLKRSELKKNIIKVPSSFKYVKSISSFKTLNKNLKLRINLPGKGYQAIVYPLKNPSRIVISIRKKTKIKRSKSYNKSNVKIDSSIQNNLRLKFLNRKGVIVLDPGHGGRDPGAVGVYRNNEKFVNLDVSKRLFKILKYKYIKNNKIFMTRQNDRYVSLNLRRRFSNKKNADVFISIHSNSSRRRTLNGIETYFYNKKASSRRSYRLALRENMQTERVGSNLDKIFGDMWESEKIIASKKLAELTQNTLVRFLRINNYKVTNLGTKYAPFAVLKNSRRKVSKDLFPTVSILIEIGFLSNKIESRRLLRDTYRQKIAEGIALGVKSYILK
ncbi:MAG: N-acetylmuramoyl-L-alanine amidase [bacterium]